MKKFRRLRKSKKGMTLVELVVAIAVVSIVFSAAMGAIVHGYAAVVQNNSAEEASIRAQGVADTVASTLGDVINDKTITDYDAAVLEAINGVVGSYDGISQKLNNVEFYNGITGSIGDFPDDSSTKEIHCAIEKIDNLSTTKVGSANVNCTGYRIMVIAPSSQGDITVTSMVTFT